MKCASSSLASLVLRLPDANQISSLLLGLIVVAPLNFATAQSGIVYLPPASSHQTPAPKSQTNPTNSQVKELTVDDVIKLAKAGLSDDLIIQRIRKKGQPFDLSADQIVQLKTASVSERVIEVMINPTISTVSTTAETNPAPVAPASVAPASVAPVPAASAPAAQQRTSAGAVVKSPGDRPSPQKVLPNEPGMYLMVAYEYTKILGQAVAFERTGSRLVSGLTLHIKAAHNNIQLPGSTAQTITGAEPVFAFVPSQHETENGVTAGDLLLIKLEVHGDRRQIEIAAGGAGRGSAGVSITHQLAATRTDLASGKYEIRPAGPLNLGEYALFLQRGEGLPALLYDFSVRKDPRR